MGLRGRLYWAEADQIVHSEFRDGICLLWWTYRLAISSFEC